MNDLYFFLWSGLAAVNVAIYLSGSKYNGALVVFSLLMVLYNAIKMVKA